MKTQNTQNYYLDRKNKLLKNFAGYLATVKTIMLTKYEKNFVDTACDEMLQAYTDLIPQIPYIGGDENRQLTQSLIFAIQFLAVYQVLKKYGKPVPEIGNIVLSAAEILINSHSFLEKILDKITWRLMFTNFFKKMMAQAAKKTQERKYPEDFVYDFVDCDCKEFDFGWNFTECAVCKFFHAHNADEFTPYVCHADFIVSKAANSGLVRTSTLASGGKLCDFRFKYGRKI